MKERKTLPFMSGWSEDEQAFAHVIIEIVEHKYKYLRKVHVHKNVKLENIKIELKILIEEYVPDMQGIDPGEEPEKAANKMLYEFQKKGEIKKYLDGLYHLNKSGNLYNHLHKSKRGSAPYMVEGGDSEGKVTYTYPTGNSEDY